MPLDTAAHRTDIAAQPTLCTEVLLRRRGDGRCVRGYGEPYRPALRVPTRVVFDGRKRLCIRRLGGCFVS
jgi:hypothetical protein